MALSNEQLIDKAIEAREQAYSQYSGYNVGAALIDDQGQLHLGCNVENAAYPLGNCAEAAAIAAMVQQGGKRIARIAVAGGRSEITACTPCGGCRQRIHEFANEDTVIIVFDDSGEWREYTIEELLPASFHLD